MLEAVVNKKEKVNLPELIAALKKIEEVELAEKIAEENGEYYTKHLKSVYKWSCAHKLCAGLKEEGVSEDSSGVPDHKTQKTEMHAVLQQRLKKGDTWCVCS